MSKYNKYAKELDALARSNFNQYQKAEEEFEKANIVVKTIRIGKNNKIKEKALHWALICKIIINRFFQFY